MTDAIAEARADALWALSRLGAPATVGDSRFELIWRELLAAWSEPHRTYHNLDHLLSCLAEWRRGRDGSEADAQVLLALLFHDAIYDPQASDNEERSADWAERAGAELGLPVAARAAISRMILATEAHGRAADEATRRLLDIDLSVLGADPARFAAYDAGIRQEYRHLADEAYRQGRTRVLQSFLGREPIYLTASFRERHEVAARRNLAQAIRRLQTGA